MRYNTPGFPGAMISIAARVGYLDSGAFFYNGRRDSKCFYINAVSNGMSGQSLTTPCVNDTTTEQNELSACHS